MRQNSSRVFTCFKYHSEGLALRLFASASILRRATLGATLRGWYHNCLDMLGISARELELAKMRFMRCWWWFFLGGGSGSTTLGPVCCLRPRKRFVVFLDGPGMSRAESTQNVAESTSGDNWKGSSETHRLIYCASCTWLSGHVQPGGDFSTLGRFSLIREYLFSGTGPAGKDLWASRTCPVTDGGQPVRIAGLGTPLGPERSKEN